MSRSARHADAHTATFRLSMGQLPRSKPRPADVSYRQQQAAGRSMTTVVIKRAGAGPIRPRRHSCGWPVPGSDRQAERQRSSALRKVSITLKLMAYLDFASGAPCIGCYHASGGLPEFASWAKRVAASSFWRGSPLRPTRSSHNRKLVPRWLPPRVRQPARTTERRPP